MDEPDGKMEQWVGKIDASSGCQAECSENDPRWRDANCGDAWDVVRELLRGNDAAIVALSLALV